MIKRLVLFSLLFIFCSCSLVLVKIDQYKESFEHLKKSYVLAEVKLNQSVITDQEFLGLLLYTKCQLDDLIYVTQDLLEVIDYDNSEEVSQLESLFVDIEKLLTYFQYVLQTTLEHEEDLKNNPPEDTDEEVLPEWWVGGKKYGSYM